jgi:hypothetical protein
MVKDAKGDSDVVQMVRNGRDKEFSLGVQCVNSAIQSRASEGGISDELGGHAVMRGMAPENHKDFEHLTNANICCGNFCICRLE